MNLLFAWLWFEFFCGIVSGSGLYTTMNRNYSSNVRFIFYENSSQINRILIRDVHILAEINTLKFDKRKLKGELEHIEIIPERGLIFDSSFNLNNIIISSETNQLRACIYYYVRGFDITVDLFATSAFNSLSIAVNFYFSAFVFFKNSLQIAGNNCHRHEFKFKRLFGQPLSTLRFGFGSKYTTSTCAWIFHNANITRLYMQDLADTFIKRNKLGFVRMNRSLTSVNSTVKLVWLQVYRIRVGKSLLDQFVFENTKTLIINGVIDSIDKGTFRTLTKLKYLQLLVDDLRSVLRTGIAWLADFNYGKRAVNLSNRTDLIVNMAEYCTLIVTYTRYDHETNEVESKFVHNNHFRDEEFCVFVDFPFDKLVFIDPQKVCRRGQCSCTDYWLLGYVYLINTYKEAYDTLSEMFALNKSFEFSTIEHRCEFEKKIQNCRKLNSSVTLTNGYKSSSKDLIFYSQVVDFVNVILIMIFAPVGIITNLTNIVVLLKTDLKRSSDEQKQITLLRFMLIYSVISLVYCVIDLNSLVTKCVDENSLFCSAVYHSQASQYYKIIAVEYAGNVLRLLSSLTYLIVSIIRYTLLEKDSKIAEWTRTSFSTWSTKKVRVVFGIIVTFACLLNSHSLIVYEVLDYSLIRPFTSYYTEYFFSLPLFIYDVNNLQRYYLYESNSSISARSLSYLVLYIFNLIFSDLLLFVIFTVFDVMLIKSLKKVIDEKQKMLEDKISADANRIVKQIKKIQDTENKILRLTTANTIFLVAIKLYGLIISIFRFIISRKDYDFAYNYTLFADFCYNIKVCNVYEDVVKVLYLISYSYSTLIFYYFNKNFRQNFIRLILCKTNSPPSNEEAKQILNIKKKHSRHFL